MASELFERIAARFPAAQNKGEQRDGIAVVEIGRDEAHELLAFLKAEGFVFLTTMCGLHYPHEAGRELGVMYQVHDLAKNARLRIKTFFPIADPRILTVTDLFATAGWMERQEFDFFGIQFEGHPDLRRILNVDDLGAFPMRKEYRLEDGTRTDKDDTFFGRDQHEGRQFERRPDRIYLDSPKAN